MQYAHNNYDITEFHGALLDIIGVMNQPVRDEQLLQAAGVKLDQILFPLLVAIGRCGPIGVVELADNLGRDYTTVSRQVAKLEGLGLVTRHASSTDRRIREAVVTEKGKATTDLVDAARERIGRRVFENWDPQEFDDLVRLMRKFADAIADGVPATKD